jgi:DNA repair exonuclease SbcCD ATPase subunit
MFKCAHISDVHWRSLKRHDEYKEVFTKIFSKLKNESLDAIFIGGDIVHSKTQGISPEIIENLIWWFNSLAEIAPVHVILGNHDGLILNEDRQDAITPIISAIDNSNITLYKSSGTYPVGVEGFNWCVFSCFDQKNWSNVKPVEDEINIACFHGAVMNSKTDTDWQLEGEVLLDFFDEYDFGFLGDIHKMQYLDKDKRIAYPGSPIQQNYGEDINKGFLIWEIKNRHDFKSKFVSISNPYPFVTIDWKSSLEETILFCEKVKKNSRFRIRTNQSITQSEIKILYHYLKNDKNAHEIVFQNNSENDNAHYLNNTPSFNTSIDIRDKEDRNKIFESYFDNIDKDVVSKIDSLFKEGLDKIPKNLSDLLGQKWSINNMQFDNTFSYGKNNFINFNKLNGVVGIFGNNRTGKSSIPGTLMYTLFNTTDRGSIKNQDVVNIRKGSCKSKVNITIGTKNYDIIRETTKKTSKSNKLSATTNLSLVETNASIDESEEQRRETEKTLRNLIGNADDFLYTSFASQGSMNTFINEKSTARKSVLSKFLNLDIYEDLYKDSREKYIVLKNNLKNTKEKNWTILKSETIDNISLKKNTLIILEEELSHYREKEVNYRLKIKDTENNINNHSSGHTYQTAEKELNYIKTKKENLESDINKLNLSTIDLENKISKISEFKTSFPIDFLKDQKEKLDSLLLELKDFKRKKIYLSSQKKNKSEEIKILDQVPCGDSFPECKFISKAHDSKKDIKDINKKVSEIEASIYEIKSVVSNLEKESISQKIEKYNDVLNKEYKAIVDLEAQKNKIESKETTLDLLKQSQTSIEVILEELKTFNDDKYIEKLNLLKTELNNTQNIIFDLETNIKKENREVFFLENSHKELCKEESNYNSIIEEWKIFDLYSYAISKKGIPTMIIATYLPRINKEINNILSGVTSFKIKILDDENNNNLNVYIDYGDSIRIIECASGMEKMMASIAIRVALTNISSLPKSDVFIIDEGFGALDTSNIEACAKLLSSLKKYFKTILIISHIDAIKDVVDKNLEVIVKGKDSYVEYR